MAFVFIHGYNVSFDAAVKLTAQLSRDMRFPGAPILYSWASAAANPTSAIRGAFQQKPGNFVM
jgi:esterase/lipase superfamily enzyme